jgi:hypothetical protein
VANEEREMDDDTCIGMVEYAAVEAFWLVSPRVSTVD